MRPLLFLPLVLGACSSSSASFAPLDLSALPKADQYPNADAIELYRSMTVVFHEVDGKPVADQIVHDRARILREDGRTYGNFADYYNRQFSAIVDAECRITRPDGTVKDQTKKQMTDTLAISDGILYDDSRIVQLDNTAPPGSVVECRSTQRHFEPKLRSYIFHFGARVPIVHARLEVIAPPDWALESIATQYWEEQSWPPQVEKGPNGETRWVWEKRDIAPLPEEPASPTYADHIPRIMVRLAGWVAGGKKEMSFKDIDDHARWLADLHRGTATPTPEIEKTVQAVLAGAPDNPREKARILYEWVQNHIRYVAVEIGLGGWRPHTAKEVFDNKYGDCKDKATLLKAMLEVAGINSTLAALYAHDGYPRRWLQPTVSNANHAIISIDLPGGPVIADPTTRAVPFGELPLADQEADLLLVKTDGGALIKAPGTTAAQNQTEVSIELELSRTGKASGKYRVVARGAYAAELRREILTGNDLEKKNAVERPLGLEQGAVKRVKFEEKSDPAGGPHVVTAEGELNISNLLEGTGATRVFRLSKVFVTPGRALPSRERTSSVVLPLRERRVRTVKLKLPEGSGVGGVPAPAGATSEFGRYELVWQVDGREVDIRSEYELTERIIAKEKYGALKQFFDAIIAIEATGVVVRGGEGK